MISYMSYCIETSKIYLLWLLVIASKYLDIVWLLMLRGSLVCAGRLWVTLLS